MIFTNKFKQKTKNSNLRCHLAVAFDVSYFTICDWLEDEGNDKLSTLERIEILTKITSLSQEEIFEKQTA